MCGHSIGHRGSGLCLCHSTETLLWLDTSDLLSQMASSHTQVSSEFSLKSLLCEAHLITHSLKFSPPLSYKTWRSQFLPCLANGVLMALLLPSKHQLSSSLSLFEQLPNAGSQAGPGSCIPDTDSQLPEGLLQPPSIPQHLRPNVLDQPYLLLLPTLAFFPDIPVFVHVWITTEQIFNEHLLCASCGDAAVDKPDENLCFRGADILVRIDGHSNIINK